MALLSANVFEDTIVPSSFIVSTKMLLSFVVAKITLPFGSNYIPNNGVYLLKELRSVFQSNSDEELNLRIKFCLLEEPATNFSPSAFWRRESPSPKS